MLIIELRGDEVWRRTEGDVGGNPLPTCIDAPPDQQSAPSDCVELLSDWTERYTKAVVSRSETDLQRIGTELYQWLDQGGALQKWTSAPERVFEIRVDQTIGRELDELLLATPWEILSKDGIFLAADESRLFTVSRRCGGTAEPATPQYSDLSLMFMAAAPKGQHELNYEAEEAAILEATRSKLNSDPLVKVQVEESGALEFLTERLHLDGPFDILHLSCHGDILIDKNKDQTDSPPTPMLLFETETGSAHPVSPIQLIGALEGQMSPLVFVSACRTAERGAGRSTPALFEGHRRIIPDAIISPRDIVTDDEEDASTTEAPPGLADPFVRQLSVRVPNVLGWDGSVYDTDAALFAEKLYGNLARGETVARAAARARRELFKVQTKTSPYGRHWHLARVYLGPGGGGVLCDPTLDDARPARPDPEIPFLDKHDKQVPVATRAEFVGRRRQIQAAIGAFRGGAKGVLIHGMGNLGKSSLAARVAARMPRHRIAVVFGDCHALAILKALTQVVDGMTDEMTLADAQELQGECAELTRQVLDNDSALENALRRLLKKVFKTHPILLILDDLEQSLENPSADQSAVLPQPDYVATLGAVFNAFQAVSTPSRFLLTSRFDFSLPDGSGNDLTQGLFRIPLAPMHPREQRKQWQARLRTTGKETDAVNVSATLLESVLTAATGNPGLQAQLTRPLLNGEETVVRAAIDVVNEFRSTGKTPPKGVDVGDFFARMAFEKYRNALSPTQKRALTAMTVFAESVPIPRSVLELVLNTFGIENTTESLDRLLALGLVDDWGTPQAGIDTSLLAHCGVNPLARSLADTLSETDQTALATALVPTLFAAWQIRDGEMARDARAVEVTRLALLAEQCEPALLDSAGTAATLFHFDRSHDAQSAVELSRAVLEVLEERGHPPNQLLVRKSISAAERIGDVNWQDRLLTRSIARKDLDPLTRSLFLGHQADRLTRLGELDEALRIRQEDELPVYEALGDKRSIAITQGQIADILVSRGELDEALRIRLEDELPVYEALGDKQAIAVTKGKIADILVSRGELDEALRIRLEDELPVYEALGDKRSIAITQGKIADILESRGELNEALRIRQEDQLPVYEALGDKQAIAVTKGQIADILESRGELNEALRIRQEDELPVYEALGDKRSIAITKGQIADILVSRGELDEALRIRQEDELPVYEALGDKRSIAITQGQIADILVSRGELDEALRIRQEDELPVYEALGDKRSIAVTQGKIADILVSRGELDEALDLHLERLPIAQYMQDLDSLVHIRFSCVNIRLQRGDHKQEGFQTIVDELSEAYAGSLKLQRPDFIGPIGLTLGQILVNTAMKTDAISVLRKAAAAFEQIQQDEKFDQCRTLIDHLEGELSSASISD